MEEHKPEKEQLAELQRLRSEQKFEEFFALAERAVKDFPDSYQLKYVYAEVLIQYKRMDEAESILKDLMLTYPDNINLLTMLGKVTFDLAKYNEASEYFNKILFLDPFNFQAKDALSKIERLKRQQAPAAPAPPIPQANQAQPMAPGQQFPPASAQRVPPVQQMQPQAQPYQHAAPQPVPASPQQSPQYPAQMEMNLEMDMDIPGAQPPRPQPQPAPPYQQQGQAQQPSTGHFEMQLDMGLPPQPGPTPHPSQPVRQQPQGGFPGGEEEFEPLSFDMPSPPTQPAPQVQPQPPLQPQQPQQSPIKQMNIDFGQPASPNGAGMDFEIPSINDAEPIVPPPGVANADTVVEMNVPQFPGQGGFSSIGTPPPATADHSSFETFSRTKQPPAPLEYEIPGLEDDAYDFSEPGPPPSTTPPQPQGQPVMQPPIQPQPVPPTPLQELEIPGMDEEEIPMMPPAGAAIPPQPSPLAPPGPPPIPSAMPSAPVTAAPGSPVSPMQREAKEYESPGFEEPVMPQPVESTTTPAPSFELELTNSTGQEEIPAPPPPQAPSPKYEMPVDMTPPQPEPGSQQGMELEIPGFEEPQPQPDKPTEVASGFNVNTPSSPRGQVLEPPIRPAIPESKGPSMKDLEREIDDSLHMTPPLEQVSQPVPPQPAVPVKETSENEVYKDKAASEEEEFMTESAAELYMTQGLIDDALRVYERLYSIHKEEKYKLKIKEVSLKRLADKKIQALNRFENLIKNKGGELV